MGGKRKKKLTLFGAIEGDREEYLLTVLLEIYNPREAGINSNFPTPNGGTPDKLVADAMKECHRDRSFAWFDEDFDPHPSLSKEVRESLADRWNIPQEDRPAFHECAIKNLQPTYNSKNKKKPTLIISEPVCVDGLILQILGVKPPYETYTHHIGSVQRDAQINAQKGKLNELVGEQKEVEFYREKLNRGVLEEKRKELPVLNLLISMLTK